MILRKGQKMNKFEPDIAKANAYLEAAVARCIFRSNGLCQDGCAARDYCEPEANDLLEVRDIFVENDGD